MLDRLVLALTAVSALAISGCPSARCPSLPHTTPEGLIQAHRALRSHAVTIRAEARVDQRGPDGRIRGTVMMFIQRPDRVRFDAMTQFGPAAILTSDGSGFAFTDLRENRYLVGPTCPENIARLLGIPMAGEDVARLLLGDTPLLEGGEPALMCTDDGTYMLSIAAPDGRRQEVVWAIRPADLDRPPVEQRLRLIRSQVYKPGGEIEWRATFHDYTVIEDPQSDEDPRLGVAMPMKVRFEHPGEGADTLLRFESVDLNVDVPPDAFSQRPRPGIAIEEVACD